MQSSSRNGAKVLWLAVHTTEGIMRAKDLRDWATWPGSSHAANDETGALLTPADGFVPYDRAAWTLRNGNPISENLEQCGWAKWTRADWLARPKLIDSTAMWLADRSRARGIPLVRLSGADIRAKKPGVLGHGDYTSATGDGTHTDPGKYYPWDVVLAKANWLLNPTPLQEVPDLDANQAKQLDEVHRMLTGRFAPGDRNTSDVAIETMNRVFGIESSVAALAKNSGASAQQIADLLRPTLAEAVRAGMGADNDAQADEIVDRLAQRLAGTA